MRSTGGTSAGAWRRAALTGWTEGPRGDMALYLASATVGAGLAVVTAYHGHRIWGLCAMVAYLGAAVATWLWHRRGGATHRHRLLVAAAAFATTALLPLAVLVVQRAHGVPWSAQPEVEVVERMARLLLDSGTPYANLDERGDAVHFRDYTPYLPAMAVFGLARVLADGLGPLAAVADARVVFAVAAAALTTVALRVAHADGQISGLPVRAVQLVAVLPATTLTLATGGDDLPVLALLVLALTCCQGGRVVTAGLAGGFALAMKFTAAPVLLVLAVAVHHQHRRAGAFAATVVMVAGGLMLPSVLLSPAELVEHVIRFPAGLTGVTSPAASPLPGYLLAQTGPTGRTAALVILALAALAVLVWVLCRPPRTAAEAAGRAATGLAVAMLLMPATRYGYLVYPLVLTGAAIALGPTRTPDPGAETGESSTRGRGATEPAAE